MNLYVPAIPSAIILPLWSGQMYCAKGGAICAVPGTTSSSCTANDTFCMLGEQELDTLESEERG